MYAEIYKHVNHSSRAYVCNQYILLVRACLKTICIKSKEERETVNTLEQGFYGACKVPGVNIISILNTFFLMFMLLTSNLLSNSSALLLTHNGNIYGQIKLVLVMVARQQLPYHLNNLPIFYNNVFTYLQF